MKQALVPGMIATLSFSVGMPSDAGRDVDYSVVALSGMLELGLNEPGVTSELQSIGFRGYSVTPQGHIAFSASSKIDDENDNRGEYSIGITWILEYVGGFDPPSYAWRRTVFGGKPFEDAQGNILFLQEFSSFGSGALFHGPILIGDNEIGQPIQRPVGYALGIYNQPSSGNPGYGNPFFAYTPSPSDPDELLETRLFFTGDDNLGIETLGPTMRVSSLGANLISEFGLKQPNSTNVLKSIITLSAPGGQPRTIATDDEPIPTLSAESAVWNLTDKVKYINAHRDCIFAARYNGTAGSGNLIAAYDHSAPVGVEPISIVAKTGEPAVGITDATYSTDLFPLGLNDFGHFAFTGRFASPSGDGEALWINKGTGIELMLKTGDAAPGLSDPNITIESIHPNESSIEGGNVTETGYFFFTAQLNVPGSGSDQALYVANLDGSYYLIARDSDLVIGVEGATFGNIYEYIKGPNRNGRITFQTTYNLPGGGTKTGVFLTDQEFRPHVIVNQGEPFIYYPNTNTDFVASDIELTQISDTNVMAYYGRKQDFSDSILFCTAVVQFGDVNNNGIRNAEDIDLVASAIALNGQPGDVDQDGDVDDFDALDRFDLNNDGVVDQDDFDYWVDPIAMVALGDTDLDGDVDDADLANGFSNYTGAVGAAGGKGWADGDTDGDGDVDDADLSNAFSNYTGS